MGQENLTETERRVIDILVGTGVAGENEAVYAVDRAMGWATSESRKFIDGLVQRGLVHNVPIVRDGFAYDPRWQWKEGTR